jgi:membrane protease YdiL (CAAX protease family)
MTLTISRWRWLAAFGVGVLLWFLSTVPAGLITLALFGQPDTLTGMSLAVFGVLRLGVALVGLMAALAIVRRTIGDLGSWQVGWRNHLLIGGLIGVLLPLLQFALVIPATGGALREDVIASRSLIGDGWMGLVGVLILSWTLAAVGEELFFRGHIIYTMRGWLGSHPAALGVAIAVSVLLFAATHAYQGWVGMVDVGLTGLLYAVLYYRSGSLLPSMIAHGINNSLLFIGLYMWY